MQKNIYFVKVGYSVAPQNKLQNAIREFAYSLNNSLIDDVENLESEIREKIKALNEDFPKCTPEKFDFYYDIRDKNFILGSKCHIYTYRVYKNTLPVPDESKWQKFQDDLKVWSDKTFGPVSTPVSKLFHLQKETTELIHAIAYEHGFDEIRFEFADCIMLLIDSASHLDRPLSIDQLFEAMQEKFDIIQKREWGIADKNGVVEHIKK